MGRSKQTNAAKRQLTEREKEFLLSEFEKAWDMILEIDKRRFGFVSSYSAIFLGVLAFLSNSILNMPEITIPTAVIISSILVLTTIIGWCFMYILNSEWTAPLD